MYIFLIIIHVIVCLVLIAVILLQAGRGGGLSEIAGGNQTQSIFGTQTNKFMTRATEVCAVVFIITSLALGVLSTQRGKSLIQKERLLQDLKTNLPAAAVATPPPAAEAPAPVAEAPAAVPAPPAPQGNAN